MAITMYYGSVPVFLQLLPATSVCLDKAQAFAEARKYDPALFLSARLSPDMFPLARQVQQATLHACAAGRVAGLEVPKFTDTGATIAELKARIATTIDFLKGIQPAQMDGKENTDDHGAARPQHPYLQGADPALSPRHAELLFSHHHRLRHPAALRRRSSASATSWASNPAKGRTRSVGAGGIASGRSRAEREPRQPCGLARCNSAFKRCHIRWR